ncbi:DUF742 domain-containing protein [Actinomadura flavalba]|uniref:DUF742 domain-containing protein n=1 Tax=Actinomadura flavalba TaxID=1120938 RepID=UPI000381EABA|nr:DUF742 domain-containing protein [Actinomadura flavalba]
MDTGRDRGGDARRERWVDEAAGPLVRPYALTRGRTRARGGALDLVTILRATGARLPDGARLASEQRRLLALCARPCTVADLASDVALPLGVVQVLIGDLLDQGLVEVARRAPTDRLDPAILRKIRDELRAL